MVPSKRVNNQGLSGRVSGERHVVLRRAHRYKCGIENDLGSFSRVALRERQFPLLHSFFSCKKEKVGNLDYG